MDTVVISHQHDPDVAYDELRETVIEEVIKPILEPTGLLDETTRCFVNPTGRFVILGVRVPPCGPVVCVPHCVAVRKLCTRNKADPTAMKVQLAYAIAVPFPVSVMVDTFGTGTVPEAQIESAVQTVFDLTPCGIITTLDLLKPIYRNTVAYGHLGRSEFRWERTDRVGELQTAAG